MILLSIDTTSSSCLTKDLPTFELHCTRIRSSLLGALSFHHLQATEHVSWMRRYGMATDHDQAIALLQAPNWRATHVI